MSLHIGKWIEGMHIGRNLKDFFHSLFNSAQKAYDALPEADKQALKNGSGLIAIVNETIGKTPAEVRAIIAEKLPMVDEKDIETTLFGIAHSFNIGLAAKSIDDVIVSLQNYLSALHGNLWETVMHSLASVGTILFSKDSTTKAGALISLLEYVYQTFIKKAQ